MYVRSVMLSASRRLRIYRKRDETSCVRTVKLVYLTILVKYFVVAEILINPIRFQALARAMPLPTVQAAQRAGRTSSQESGSGFDTKGDGWGTCAPAGGRPALTPPFFSVVSVCRDFRGPSCNRPEMFRSPVAGKGWPCRIHRSSCRNSRRRCRPRVCS